MLDRIRPADALKARDSGFTTALVVPAAGVLPGRSVLLSLAGETAEQMAWRQPAALHLHMSTLARQYPGSLMGTVAYARQALYDARRYRELWTAYEKAPAGKKRPALRPGARRLGRRDRGPHPADRHGHAARTTCGARWRWATSSRSR